MSSLSLTLRHRLALLAATLIALLPRAFADDSCMAVLYPEVREPYRIVLEEIIAGIEEASDWQVQRFPIPNPTDKTDTDTDFPEFQCGALIGLGRSGLRAATTFSSRMPVVAGAVLLQPGESSKVPTISFVPDPAELFTRAQHFLPTVKTITVVFDPQRSGKLIEQAVPIAATMGLKLVTLEAENLRSAAVIYKRVLDQSNRKTDALWLIQDPSTIDSGAVLNSVLERAWKRKLLVFSSQVAHVKHGVLFGVYPDNRELGHRLAQLATDCAGEGCSPTEVMPLRDLGTAVNIRTASRLGISVDQRRDPYLDLILPTR